MNKYFFLLSCVLFLLVTTTHAESLQVSGNAAGSQNSISVDNNNSQTIKQTNSLIINNNIDAKASTGGNDVSKNTGNSTIKTGDAKVNTSVTNIGNTNINQTNCPTCKTTPTITPKLNNPTSTPVNNNTGGGNGDDNNNDGSNSGGIGGAEITNGDPGEILGLAATSGENTAEIATILGTLCVTIGSLFLTVKQK